MGTQLLQLRGAHAPLAVFTQPASNHSSQIIIKNRQKAFKNQGGFQCEVTPSPAARAAAGGGGYDSLSSPQTQLRFLKNYYCYYSAGPSKMASSDLLDSQD